MAHTSRMKKPVGSTARIEVDSRSSPIMAAVTPMQPKIFRSMPLKPDLF